MNLFPAKSYETISFEEFYRRTLTYCTVFFFLFFLLLMQRDGCGKKSSVSRLKTMFLLKIRYVIILQEILKILII